MVKGKQPLVRERVALIHHDDSSGLNPEDIKYQDGRLTIPKFEAFREDRLTIQLEGLPAEVVRHIEAFSSLSLRWTSPWSHGVLDPLASRSPPGLHATYKPSRDGTDETEHACYFLKFFGVSSCDSELFQSQKFKPGDDPLTHHFYQSLEDLSILSQHIKSTCSDNDSACRARADELKSATGFEVTYKAGKPVKVTASWPYEERAVSVSSHQSRRTEVGIFAEGTHFDTGPHSLGLMGTLIVLDDQGKLSPVSFQINSRHRSTASHFSSSFLRPTGLHPSLQLRISSNKPPQTVAQCSLYAYLSLPKAIFPDQYQLDDELFMASKNLTSLAQQWGIVDLEAPAYRTKTWGSNVLLELAPPPSTDAQEWTAEIPLHLRYLEPTATGQSREEVPYPAVFWACEAGKGEIDFTNNPFDRMHTGYDAQFSETTSFWHLQPQPETGKRLTNSISVPVLKAAGAEWVEAGTSAVIALGFGWVLWKLARSLSMFGYGSKKGVKPTKSS